MSEQNDRQTDASWTGNSRQAHSDILYCHKLSLRRKNAGIVPSEMLYDVQYTALKTTSHFIYKTMYIS